MNIPRHWAEARSQHREKGRQITVRRFGWSAASHAEAERMAQERVAEALQKILGGAKLARFEPKVAYNGADGVPIREEIVAEHGDSVITRNSYGALCLNTPDVLFADMDFEARAEGKYGCLLILALVAGAILGARVTDSVAVGIAGMIGGCLLAPWWLAKGLPWWRRRRGGPDRQAQHRITDFMAAHPTWRLRVYRTPAGLRVLAMHRTFAPGEPEVAAFFEALNCDPVYVRMCERQQCFRARVSPKPWRIGVGPIRPRTGVWPLAAYALPAREAWVRQYQAKSAEFGSCRFLTELGNGTPHDKARAVQELHDRLCRADTELPIA